jgi:hypothetical protein
MAPSNCSESRYCGTVFDIKKRIFFEFSCIFKGLTLEKICEISEEEAGTKKLKQP